MSLDAADRRAIADAADRAFAAGADPATALDTLGALHPLGPDGLALATACVIVTAAAQAGVAFPVGPTILAATLRGPGSAADLRAEWTDGGPAPCPPGTRWLIHLTGTATRIVAAPAPHAAPTDPLQGAPWVALPAGGTTLPLPLLAPARILTAAAILGHAEAAQARALDHLRTRRQFGRPLGSFQTLRHRAAEDWVRLEDIRAAVDEAAAIVDAGHDATRAARLAKAIAADHGPRIAENALHALGAQGFTADAGLGGPLTAIRRAAAQLGTAATLFKAIGSDYAAGEEG